MQYIRVEVTDGRAYTYIWDDETEPALEPGEPVYLPGNVVHQDAFLGRVLRVLDGPDKNYDGSYKAVLRRACSCFTGYDDDCPAHGLGLL